MFYNIDSAFWKTKESEINSQKNFLSIHAENPAKVHNDLSKYFIFDAIGHHDANRVDGAEGTERIIPAL